MEPFIGEIRLFSFAKAPDGWLACDGARLAIASYQALYALLGNTYGGDLRTYFQLPDLRGRVPMHTQLAAGPTQHLLGSAGGTESVTLTTAQMPVHTHQPYAFTTAGDAANPAGNFPAATAPPPSSPSAVPPALYIPEANAGTTTTLDPSTVANFGGSQGHENRQPSLALTYCIAYQGLYPPRS